ncbi:Ubiquinone biosynthesis O-methyltransferase, mitochondrial [Linum perenne]
MAAKLLTRLRQLHAPQPHHRILHSFRILSRNSISTSPPLPPAETPPPPGNAGETRRKSSSLKEHELAKFSAIADTWKNPQLPKPFEGLRIVDVGCGGGILSEPLARLGATVTGVDAVDKNIKIASLHSDLDPSTSTIEYICTTAEKLVEEGRQFDAVMALEVIEHVAEPAEFCKSLAALTRPGGAIVISTINRSMRAYAAAIVAAEYILNWLPRGTHQWSSFLTPEELAMILKRSSIDVEEMAGFALNPLTRKWILCDDLGVNFIAFATKNAEHEGQEEFISSQEEPSSIAK